MELYGDTTRSVGKCRNKVGQGSRMTCVSWKRDKDILYMHVPLQLFQDTTKAGILTLNYRSSMTACEVTLMRGIRLLDDTYALYKEKRRL